MEHFLHPSTMDIIIKFVEIVKNCNYNPFWLDRLKEYVKTGKIQSFEDLKKEMPETLGVLLSVPSLGPKTAKLLFDELHVADIDTLEQLAREHKLSELPGIKEKTEENIIKGIEMLRRGMVSLFKSTRCPPTSSLFCSSLFP